jgi:hypothetical protein
MRFYYSENHVCVVTDERMITQMQQGALRGLAAEKATDSQIHGFAERSKKSVNL